MVMTPEELLLLEGWESEKGCANMLGISQRALARLRRKGEAPPYVRLTPRGQVRYPKEGIGEYLLQIYLDSFGSAPSRSTNEGQDRHV